MVRLLSSAVAATALILGMAQATPLDNLNGQKMTFEKPIGFDPNYVQKQGRMRAGVIPEEIILTEKDYAAHESVTEIEPIVVPHDVLAKRFINGADDRVLHDKLTTLPIGRLQWSNGMWCTGTLVAPRLVLTAKHCVVAGETGTFSPGYDKTSTFGWSTVVNYMTSELPWGNFCGWEGDWAVLLLEHRLGALAGTFGVKLAEKSKVDQAIFKHVGYPNDKDNGQRPYRTEGNPILSLYNAMNWNCSAYGPYFTDTDSASGQSGGPHWETVNGNKMIWGVLSTSIKLGPVAFATWGTGQKMINAINILKVAYP